MSLQKKICQINNFSFALAKCVFDLYPVIYACIWEHSKHRTLKNRIVIDSTEHEIIDSEIITHVLFKNE